MEPQPQRIRFGSVPDTLANLAWWALPHRCRWDTPQWKCVRFTVEQGTEDVWVSIYPPGSWILDERSENFEGIRRLKDRLLHDHYEVIPNSYFENQAIIVDPERLGRDFSCSESSDSSEYVQPSTSTSVGCVRKGKRKRSDSTDEMPKKKSKKSQSEPKKKQAKKCQAEKKQAKKRQAKEKQAKKRQAKKKLPSRKTLQKPKRKQEPSYEEDVLPSTSTSVGRVQSNTTGPAKTCIRAKKQQAKKKHVCFNFPQFPRLKSGQSNEEFVQPGSSSSNVRVQRRKRKSKKSKMSRSESTDPAASRKTSIRKAKRRQAKRKMPSKKRLQTSIEINKQEPSYEEDVQPSTSTSDGLVWRGTRKSCEKKSPKSQSELNNTTGSRRTSIRAASTETEMQEPNYEEDVQPSTSTSHGRARGGKRKNSESTEEIPKKQSKKFQEESSDTTGSRKTTIGEARKRRAKKK